MQQVLAFESDLLEHEDLFEGSLVVERPVADLVAGATAEIDRVQAHGRCRRRGRERLHEAASWSRSHSARRARDRVRRRAVVGVNVFTTTEPIAAARRPRHGHPERRPRRRGGRGGRPWSAGGRARRGPRRGGARRAARRPPTTDTNLVPATLECARAGATTGEWAGALREVFGEYRAPTGVSGAVGRGRGRRGAHRRARGGPRVPATSSATGSASWSASRGSTGTATAPSRSRSARATPVSRSSTRASG